MADHACQQWSEADLERLERESEDKEASAPAPPIANVALALELATGANAERRFHFHGQDYRFKPTPYGVAIRTQAWTQALERYESMAKADPKLLADHLPELRECYQELADIAQSLLVEHRGPNPFLEAEPADFHRLSVFTLDSGNEIRVSQQRKKGVPQRSDTAYSLYVYLAHFGAVPGMVILEDGRPEPASWRHFVMAMHWLRRNDAEETMGRYVAHGMTQAKPETQERWWDRMQELAGSE